MAGAALDHLQIGIGDEAQHLRRLLPDVLRAGVAGDVQRDAAGERLQARRQAFAAGDLDHILARCRRSPRTAVLTLASSGRISGHSNFSISAQDGTSAITS